MSGAQQIGLSINLLTICLVVAGLLFVRRYRRAHYSTGWLDGRLALLLSMQEAQQRGIPVDEWVKAEARRDAANHDIPGLLAAIERSEREERERGGS
jgi:hypothetical protein